MEKVSVKKDGRVFIGDVCIGTVRKVESSKTGFRRGYCIGQVSCNRYEAVASDGTHLRVVDIGGFRVGHLRQVDAVAALVKHAEEHATK